jgi:hypothetical protein
MALAARKHVLGDCGQPNKKGEAGKMKGVHKSIDSKDAHVATASLKTTKAHFNFNQSLTNKSPRLTMNKLFIVFER